MEKIKVIPRPKSVLIHKEGAQKITPCVFSECDCFDAYIDTFIEFAKKLNRIELKRGEGGIELLRDEALACGEYRIDCHSGVKVFASDCDGLTSAFATLHQIMTEKDGFLLFHDCTVSDKPDCAYRALMVDLARKWHTASEITDYIDLCYLYKIKYIHLHFTDSQGYTLPSDIFPKLPTEGKSYTKSEIAYLNDYAISRNIEIIPELDIPGHSAKAKAAYPELFEHTPIEGKCDEHVLCIGKPNLLESLRKIIVEIMEMFPNSRYFHIGGDEANFDTCYNCRDCMAHMEKLGVNSVKALYTRFIKDITDTVLELGRTPIVWEGFPKEGAQMLSRDIIVTAWESLYHLPNELIDEGFTVTNSSWLPLYIVPPTHKHVAGGRWYPEDILEWNIYTWRNWWKKSFAAEKPITVTPTDKVIGGTLCAWECTYAEDILPITENLAAFSERLWNSSCDAPKAEILSALERLSELSTRLVDAQG